MLVSERKTLMAVKPWPGRPRHGQRRVDTLCVISVVGHVGYAFSLGRRCCAVSLRETPQRSGGVFALAVAAESGDQFEHRVEGGFERFGVALDLGEEQTAL